jgi:polyhydroxybutyrate depolymerase
LPRITTAFSARRSRETVTHRWADDSEIALSIHGSPRRYLLHVPPAAGERPWPAVILLHGAGGSAAWARDETDLNDSADRDRFVAAYPDGLAIDPNQPSAFLTNPQVWNAGAGPGLIVNRGPDDVAFLSAVIEDLPRRAPVDPQRIFVTGFSNGAAMTFRLAAERPESIAAIAPVAGYCPHVPAVSRPMPTLFIIGDSDPLVPVLGGEIRSPWDGRVEPRPPIRDSLDRWAAALAGGSAFDLFSVSDEAGVRLEEYRGLPRPFQVLTIAGLGHHWPGGRSRLKRSIAGPPSHRIRANDVIWRFFQEVAGV